MNTGRYLIAAFVIYPIFVHANDFPTQARVEYVLGCMNQHGGQSYDTLYSCVCSIDKIAAQMPYKSYVDAQTLSYMIKTPGEKGGAFRDAPGARGTVKKLAKLKKKAESSCFVKKIGLQSDGSR